jgi:hypothetical protein
LLENLNAARGALDTAARGLAGEQVDQPMDMGDEEIPVDLPDLSDLDSEEDAFAAADAATGGDTDQGRDRR